MLGSVTVAHYATLVPLIKVKYDANPVSKKFMHVTKDESLTCNAEEN
jgi:hypothetical protein